MNGDVAIGAGTRIVLRSNPGIFVNRKVTAKPQQRLVDARPVRQQFRDLREPRPRQMPYREGQAAPISLPTPPVAPAELTFVQSTPLAIWVIPHNLGHYPSVTTVDTDNEVMIGDVTYPELDVVIVSFSVPVAGIAYLV